VRANLVEVFSSVQGEGPDLGRSTLFVRFGGCDLRCRWCDSPHTWRPAPRCRLETGRGSGAFRELPNPLALEEVEAAARALDVAAHRMVSLTGGEPLLQPEAALELARSLGALGPEVLLETHGLHAEALRRVLPALDVVSMDWKLASDVRRATDPEAGPPVAFHDEHAAFLAVARSARRVVVKVVVTTATQEAEIDEVVRRLARGHAAATLVLQPVTPAGSVVRRPEAGRVLALAARAEATIRDVRVIPQTHPLFGAP
jgi:7-carboxy-7-deazaguanine synthase